MQPKLTCFIQFYNDHVIIRRIREIREILRKRPLDNEGYVFFRGTGILDIGIDSRIKFKC